jgi:metabolite-proton symporter
MVGIAGAVRGTALSTSHEKAVVEPQSRTSIVKVVGASLVGTTVEWYDFFLYGSAAALIFNKLFFPSFDPLVGTLLAFATYAVGFAARPVGGVIFGHFGDKVGRKQMLVITLMLMGGATFLIGLLPTYESIGVWAPILLITLRLIQGFALGGEWGGAVLMAAEYGTPERRGFWASWPQSGAPAGNLLAVAVLAVVTATTTPEQFDSWGWRIPFLLSAVLVLVGLYIRVSIEESPVFRAAREQAAASEEAPKLPVVQVLREYPREIILAIGARLAENISYYIFTAFALAFATRPELGISRSTALNAALIASAIHFIAIPLMGAASDRFGRRPVYLVGALGVGVWGFVFFALYNTQNFGLLVLAGAIGLIFHGAMYGPQAAFFSEMFSTQVRYSGLSVAGQVSSIVAGSMAPIIATALLIRYGSSVPISIYLAGAAVLTLVAVFASRETARSDLTRDVLADRVAAGRR